MVKDHEIKGLDHKSGLQGQFRKTAHQLAESVKAAGDKGAFILLLELRKHEKDYLLRHDRKYVQKASSVNFSRKMADGDLTQTLDIDQQDEIGTLARALNHMGANLLKMFQNIAGGVDTGQ